MSNEVKVAYFGKNTPKSKVLKAIGDIVLDNICISCELDEDLATGDYYLDGVFIIDDDGRWKSIEEEGILKVKTDYGYEIFDIVKIIKNTRDITVFARQHTIEKQLSTRLEDVRPENQNGYSALQWMLKNSTEYKEGRSYARELEFSSDIETISTAYYQGMCLYEALFDCEQSFINRWGGEIQRHGYKTTINKKIGEDRGFQVRYAKNLKGFESETNIDSVYTRIKPKAYNGYTIDGYVQSSNIDKYATVRTATIKYEDVKLQEDCEDDEIGYETLEELQSELIRRAKLEFSENHIDEIQGTYTVNFEDLSKTEEYKKYAILEKVYLGDTVNVFIDKLNINISVRAIRRRYNVMTQKVIEVELSNLDLTEFKPKSFAEVVKEINKLPESLQNVLQQAREDATDLINAGINGFVVVNKNEILIMDTADKNTATNVWRWNVNGLGFSSTGYNGQFNTALTMDGKMVLNELTCEGINAMLINVGVLKSLNNTSWLNIDNGTFDFANGNFAYDGTNLQMIGKIINVLNGYGIEINRGGLSFATEGETVAGIRSSRFATNTNINGLSIANTRDGDYIDVGFTDNENFDTAAQFSTFLRISKIEHELMKNFKGIQFLEQILLKGNKTFWIESNDSNKANWHEIYNTVGGILALFGDNGIMLGYKNGNEKVTLFEIDETANDYGSRLFAYDQLSMTGHKITSASDIYANANNTRYLHEGWVGSIEKTAKRISNLNIMLDSGWYSWGSGANGAPSDYGILLCLKWGEGDLIQIAFTFGSEFYIRYTVNNSGYWTNWIQK